MAKKQRSPNPHLPEVTCACGRQMAWASRPVSPEGKPGPKVPLDPVATCFIGVLVDGEMRAVTFREFTQRVRRIELTTGEDLPVERLVGFFVTHFATCKDAAAFSRQNFQKR